ncbi:MAG: hypothetical protein QOH89_1692 [Pseudonocardiales bacterium]|nr:hypothetical protein [Pseudonocardiales bacterium]
MTGVRERTTAVAKVPPRITAIFWLLKLITTALGEATGDFLATINLVLTAAVGLLIFAGAMWWQLRSPRYDAFRYWSAVAAVAVFGTLAADGIHIVLGVPYLVSSVVFALATATVFAVWGRVEGTLDIHSIDTQRRELFYWLAVLMTFALGTAAGDLTATTLGLGYAGSIVLFAVVICIPLVGRYALRMPQVLAFWFAYVITRPLGASIADFLGKKQAGGRGYGDGPVTAVLLVLFLALVLAVSRSERARARTA